jgi:hypothetical protein
LTRCRQRSAACTLTVTSDGAGEPGMAATVARLSAPMRSPGWFVSVLTLTRFEPDTFRRRLVAFPGRWRPSAWPSVTGLPSSPVRGEDRGVVVASSAGWSGVVIWRGLVSRGVVGPGTGSGVARLHRLILFMAGDSG